MCCAGLTQLSSLFFSFSSFIYHVLMHTLFPLPFLFCFYLTHTHTLPYFLTMPSPSGISLSLLPSLSPSFLFLSSLSPSPPPPCWQHFAILLKYIIHVAIPDIPSWVGEEMAKLEFQRREAFKVTPTATQCIFQHAHPSHLPTCQVCRRAIRSLVSFIAQIIFTPHILAVAC